MQQLNINNIFLHQTFYIMDEDPKFQEFLEYLAIRYKTYANDNLITFGNELSFLRDQKFIDTLFAHPEQGMAEVLAWRLHTACWAAKNALNVPGDFVECGVANAVTTTQIINYLDFKSVAKTFYLYDSFGGIPDKYVKQHKLEILNHYNKDAEVNYAKICNRFAHYANIKVIKGNLPDVLTEQCPEKIAFLNLDLSNYPSEYEVLKFLLPRIVPGGIVLFQTFGHHYYSCYKIAKADFIVARNLSILELPTGQGLMLV